MFEESFDRRQARAFAALARDSLGTPFVDGQADRDVIPVERQDGLRCVWWRASGFAVFVGEILVEEEDLDLLGAFRVELDLDLGVAPGGTIERAAGEIGAERFEHAHHFDRSRTHFEQALGLLVILVQGLPDAQFGFDLGIVGQGF